MHPKHAFDLETAFVSRGTPSLADCITRLRQDETLGKERKRDLISGLNRVAKVIHREPATVPADPTWLQPRIAAVTPARNGITPKSWSNIISNAQAALRHLGITATRTRDLSDLSEEWRALWQALLSSNDHTLARGLGRFVRFLDKNNVGPHDVIEEHIDLFREALTLNELRKDPAESALQALYAWNRAVAKVPTWPKTRLAPPRSDRNFVLPSEELPSTLVAEIDAAMHRLSEPDPLDPDSPRRGLRPATITSRRGQLFRFASALRHAGSASAEIEHLVDLVAPVNLDKGLRWILARQGNQVTQGISNLAHCLRMIARHVVKLEGKPLSEVESLLGKLIKPRRIGMTTGNRDRLRVLQNDQTLAQLYRLPGRLWQRSRSTACTYKSLLIAEEAIAIELLIHCPIRRKNLTELHLERDFLKPGNGSVFLQLAESRTKNGKVQCFELPSGLCDWIDAHIKQRAGLLCPGSSPFLFPKRDGSAPMGGQQLGKRISARIRKELGIDVHPHLFRHVSAMVLLREHPGHYELVRRVLGHSETSTTYNSYVALEADQATQLLAEAIKRSKGLEA